MGVVYSGERIHDQCSKALWRDLGGHPFIVGVCVLVEGGHIETMTMMNNILACEKTKRTEDIFLFVPCWRVSARAGFLVGAKGSEEIRQG